MGRDIWTLLYGFSIYLKVPPDISLGLMYELGAWNVPWVRWLLYVPYVVLSLQSYVPSSMFEFNF